MSSFATPADWGSLPGNVVPTDPAKLLALTRRLSSASRKIARLTRAAVYQHDVLGNAVDPGVAGALRDATLAQDAYSQATDPDGTGLGFELVTVGPVTLGAKAAPGTAGGTSTYAPAAVEVLVDAGLITARVGSQ